jgi:dTDP-4-amino-4,6-dideoxygalactose transaminase
MTNLSAGIGLAQLEMLEEKITKRRHNYKVYLQLLQSFEGITFLSETKGSFSNRWLTTIKIDPSICGFTNEELRISLRNAKIESRFLWKPLHLQPIFKTYPFFGGNIASDLFNQGLCLPSSSQLTLRDQVRVVEVIEKQFQKVC